MSNNNKDIETQALNILEKALSLSPIAQKAFLIAATANDNNLKQRVMSMWNSDKPQQCRIPSTGSGLDYIERVSRPSSIGSFEIIDELGSGGMGSVFLGKKISDDFDFYAAIKVVRKDSRSEDLIIRLKSERRTLANLRHPNIAHFYDGGETENGNPFFVMEYVKGQKLFDYIQTVSISNTKKLSIFKNICSAVAFAHQNLVIHRDITPANILISDDGIAKLIDFGIAYTLEENNEPTSSKNTGTQGYLAPELTLGQPASTITDIYSLGIVLGELIKDTQFPRSSDIDAIAKKAANSVPNKRYQSVDALIQDLLRYEVGEAVLAIKHSWCYIAKRFVSRHRLLVGAATTVFIISLLALLLISISYFRIDAAEEQSRTRFNEVRELANFMMFDLYDEVVKLDTSLAARELLIETTLNYLDQLSEVPEAPQSLSVELALGYQRMANIAGGTGAINLGERTKADNLYSEAKKQINSAYSLNPNDPDTIRAYVKIYRSIGTFEWINNLDFEEAGHYFSRAKLALHPLLKTTSTTIDDHVMNGALALSLSQSARNMSDFDNAIFWSKNGIDILNKLHLRYPTHYETQFNLAHAYIYLGEAITTQVYEVGGDLNRAVQPFDQGKHHLKALIAQKNAPTLAKAQYITALYKRSIATCQLANKRSDTLKDLKTAQQLAKKLMAEEAKNNFVEERLLATQEAYADCELQAGNIQSAYTIAENLTNKRHAKAIQTPDNPLYLSRLISSQLLIANILRSMNNPKKACMYFMQGKLNTNKFNSISNSLPSFQLSSHMDQIKSGANTCQKNRYNNNG